MVLVRPTVDSIINFVLWYTYVRTYVLSFDINYSQGKNLKLNSRKYYDSGKLHDTSTNTRGTVVLQQLQHDLWLTCYFPHSQKLRTSVRTYVGLSYYCFFLRKKSIFDWFLSIRSDFNLGTVIILRYYRTVRYRTGKKHPGRGDCTSTVLVPHQY